MDLLTPASAPSRSVVGRVGAAVALAWSAGRALTLGSTMLVAAGAAVPVVVAWLTKLGIDALVAPATTAAYLIGVGAGLAICGVAVRLAPVASRYVRQELERRVGLRAQDRLFRAAERFVGLARFEDPAFLDRMRLAHQSGGTAPGALVGSGLALAGGVATTAGLLGSLLAIAPWMALAVLLSALPAMAVELRLSSERAAMLWRTGPASRRELFYQQVLTSVQAAKELRLFGVGPYLRARMTAERRAVNREQRRTDRRELWAQSAMGGLAAAIAGIGLGWALLAAWRGELTVGDVSLFIASVAGVQAATVAVVLEASLAHHQLLLFDHYLAVVRSEPDLPVPRRPRRASALRRGIEFRDVWFRYSDDHPWTLRGVDLTIPHGRTVGLVGHNGAGKTTVVKLLCRMYDPQRGAVLWDGVDLRDLDPRELRARIGAVFQDFMRYDLTAATNIGLGAIEHLDDRARIEAAARHAGADATVSALPRGYDTLLTRLFGAVNAEEDDPQTGVPLSGGQWQRLALARAYLRGERDLLILDEPSSGLDPEAEHEIHMGLRAHRAGRTTVLISHRLAAVRDADRVLVLDGGRITEQGSHDELMRAGGRYARLFVLQARGYDDRFDEMARVGQ